MKPVPGLVPSRAIQPTYADKVKLVPIRKTVLLLVELTVNFPIKS
jgi:hypothetical protein